MNGSKTVVACARANPNSASSQKILVLAGGTDDLVAPEGMYHNTCRLKFLRNSGAENGGGYNFAAPSAVHKVAFNAMKGFIDSQVVAKRNPVLVASVMELYRSEYLANGGISEDIEGYTTQKLLDKIKNTYKDNLCHGKESNKTGNFIYAPSLSFDDAVAALKNTSRDEQEVRSTAMLLRAEILPMEKTKIPSHTTIDSLKKNAPEIPPLTKLFYKTLLSGVGDTPSAAKKRKCEALSSDAVYTVSQGNVKPWKTTALGVGFSSMLGSKSALTVLNILGHSVSDDECKRLISEIAYTCASGEKETPAGLLTDSQLATGTAWDNFDLNVETLDGKNNLHVTVGIAYQNQHVPDEHPTEIIAGPSRETSNLSGRARRTFEDSIVVVKVEPGPTDDSLSQDEAGQVEAGCLPGNALRPSNAVHVKEELKEDSLCADDSIVVVKVEPECPADSLSQGEMAPVEAGCLHGNTLPTSDGVQVKKELSGDFFSADEKSTRTRLSSTENVHNFTERTLQQDEKSRCGMSKDNEQKCSRDEVHVTSDTCEKTHTCTQCNKLFSCSSVPQAHTDTHTATSTYTCSTCIKTSGQNSTQQVDLRIQTGETPFRCNVCNTFYPNKFNYKNHNRIAHAREKLHHCTICNEPFKQKRACLVHMRTHTRGEKPYKCSVCTKTFSHPSFLNRHEKIHLEDKPYKCSKCTKSFSFSSYLDQHQKIHMGEKPYKCHMCSMSFIYSSHLTRHQRIHTEERSHNCPDCGKTFNQPTTLYQHQMLHAAKIGQ
uniref:uncharacterized protein n=1 Tax=Myxine glutinosa TaxID=7769 RepID=UPI00358FD8C4